MTSTLINLPAHSQLTTISAVVINRLEETSLAAKLGLEYIYCNYKATGQIATNVLGSLVQHLVARSPLPTDVVDLFQKHKSKGTSPSV